MYIDKENTSLSRPGSVILKSTQTSVKRQSQHIFYRIKDINKKLSLFDSTNQQHSPIKYLYSSIFFLIITTDV